MADRKNNETTSWNADEVRRQQTQRKQRKKMRRARFWAIYCAGVVLGSCLLAGLVLLGLKRTMPARLP